jgi:hypothetical protein
VKRLVLLLALAPGCATEPRPAVPDVCRQIDALAAQALALEDTLWLPANAAAACRANGCVTEPDAITFRRGEVLCRCRRGPNVGVHRLPKTSSPAMAHEPEELVSALSQDLRGELGAARGEDRADAGPVLSSAALTR